MPAKSKAQRRLIGLAEHHPEKVYARNRGILKMSHSDMHDFASTPEKGLEERKQDLYMMRRRRRKRNG